MPFSLGMHLDFLFPRLCCTSLCYCVVPLLLTLLWWQSSICLV